MTLDFGAPDALRLPEILTVGQLNQAVAGLLDRCIPLVWVSGEISNFTQVASGHWYFTLKDSRAAVRAVMFRSRALAVGFVPAPGAQVEVRARVSLYEPRGDYQIQVDSMRRAGLGNLYEAFLRLKQQLTDEGLLDVQRKRQPIRLPRRIGVVTSPYAAALRDVLSALARRAPHVLVILYPAPVQGSDAASRLAQALAQANARAEVDTLLLVRGGGSIEDLWSFNEEVLVRAVAASAIPVISGVGHETDFTLADFVADVRAPTPTAAAELACVPRAELQDLVAHAALALSRAQQRSLDRAVQRLDRAAAQLVSPAQRLRHQRDLLGALSRRLTPAWRKQQAVRAARCDLLAAKLGHRAPDLPRALDGLSAVKLELSRAQRRHMTLLRNRLDAATAHLRAFDPQHTLARGYAIVRDAQGRIVRQAAQLSAGDRLNLAFAQGTTDVTVLPPD